MLERRVEAGLSMITDVDGLAEVDIRKFVSVGLDIVEVPVRIGRSRGLASTFLNLANKWLWWHQLEGRRVGHTDDVAIAIRAAAEDPGLNSSFLIEPVKTLVSALNVNIVDSLEPWEAGVNTIEGLFGRSWATLQISTIAAGIRSRSVRVADANELFDEECSLPRRVRFARRKAKDGEWWAEQAVGITGANDAKLFLLACLTWARPECLLELVSIIDGALAWLSNADVKRLLSAVDGCLPVNKRPGEVGIDSLQTTVGCTRLSVLQLLMRRTSFAGRMSVIRDQIVPMIGDPAMAQDCAWYLSADLFGGKFDFGESLIVSSRRLAWKMVSLAGRILRGHRSSSETSKSFLLRT